MRCPPADQAGPRATPAPETLRAQLLVAYGHPTSSRGERNDVDPPAGPSQGSDAGTRPAAGQRSSHPRPEPNSGPRSSPGRSPQDHRRRRASEQRYAGWGDGIDRVWCTRARKVFPETFPVASHSGAATIPAAIVARRPDHFLLCTFSHHGPHLWPDGELVDGDPVTDAPSSETGEDPSRSRLP